MDHIIKIKSITHVTHDVLRITTEKPAQYLFVPGQATDICINKNGWRDEMRPFTFTCLPENDYLEFTIKTYPSRKSVTNELLHAKINDELILHDVFGEIGYKGKGVFIAGGAGVTPFIAIFRYLASSNQIGDNKLIFANKTRDDIINEQEFKSLLGSNFINILSEEKAEGYSYGLITADFLKKHITDFNTYIYVCGPPSMMDAIEKHLADLNINENLIVKNF